MEEANRRRAPFGRGCGNIAMALSYTCPSRERARLAVTKPVPGLWVFPEGNGYGFFSRTRLCVRDFE